MEKILVIGGSAGSFKVVSKILTSVESGFPFPIIICMHRLRNVRTGFANTLSLYSQIPVVEAKDREKIIPSKAYIAPSNYHLMVEDDHVFSLSAERPVNHSRPSIDVTMDTIAEVFRDRTVGILLSGANNDGAKGMKTIHEYGGMTLVQDPSDAEIRTMPETCISMFKPDHILDTAGLIQNIKDLARANE